MDERGDIGVHVHPFLNRVDCRDRSSSVDPGRRKDAGQALSEHIGLRFHDGEDRRGGSKVHRRVHCGSIERRNKETIPRQDEAVHDGNLKELLRLRGLEPVQPQGGELDELSLAQWASSFQAKQDSNGRLQVFRGTTSQKSTIAPTCSGREVNARDGTMPAYSRTSGGAS